MRKLTPAQATERISSYMDFYKDFNSDSKVRGEGLHCLSIPDNVEMDAHIDLRASRPNAAVLALPRQLGRSACLDAKLELGLVG